MNIVFLLKEKIKYLEKPVTDDEVAIATILEMMVRAVNNRDIAVLESIILESAQATFLGGRQRIFGKKQCILYMTQAVRRVRRFSYNNILIRVKNDKATVSCLGIIFFQNGSFKEVSRFFRFEKKNESWLLAEAEYC